MKKIIVILLAVFALGFSAKAQDEFDPGWNLTIQGGTNFTTSDLWKVNKWNHFTSDAQVALGYQFKPWFGVRGAWSGTLASYPIYQGETVGYLHYTQFGADAMFDIANLFNYNAERTLSPYAFAGLGVNYRFDNSDFKGYFGPVVRAGLGLAIRLGDITKVVVEVQANGLGNKFNTLDDNKTFGGSMKRPFPWDDNLSALVGIQIDLKAWREALGL